MKSKGHKLNPKILSLYVGSLSGMEFEEKKAANANRIYIVLFVFALMVISYLVKKFNF